jgi:hypothetical protein
MLQPRKQRLSTHWSTTPIGALAAGEFGRMGRQQYEVWMLLYIIGLTNTSCGLTDARFDDLMQHLHFSDNKSPQAATDRARKIRPVIETLQRTFLEGFVPGASLSFDEGTLPSHSKFNGARMFMKDKLHKWGTKVLLTCCSITAYCLRYEICMLLQNTVLLTPFVLVDSKCIMVKRPILGDLKRSMTNPAPPLYYATWRRSSQVTGIHIILSQRIGTTLRSRSRSSSSQSESTQLELSSRVVLDFRPLFMTSAKSGRRRFLGDRTQLLDSKQCRI